eukprot:gnl/MRDRNA2_/MRDRNA2_371587_c0_seq1.p1 gnl/MRDRNA2_/MRDRNA2_371587_c0~~gnl/MRDRNA2_/MRDRNA2_371587_c0_seq1.p1  ORF type:complete len:111 (+),score=11.56 gnl/MRDRNA2_/MRDRNA2_371587_c0_seq1:27-359(+)
MCFSSAGCFSTKEKTSFGFAFQFLKNVQDLFLTSRDQHIISVREYGHIILCIGWEAIYKTLKLLDFCFEFESPLCLHTKTTQVNVSYMQVCRSKECNKRNRKSVLEGHEA